MNKSLQLDLHPDAETLSAFAEQALGEAERSEVLAHMAICERCREVVYLARMAEGEDADSVPPVKAIEVEAPSPVAVPAGVLEMPRRSWPSGRSLAWVAAASAALLLLAVGLYVRRPAPTTEIASSAPAQTVAAQQQMQSPTTPSVSAQQTQRSAPLAGAAKLPTHDAMIDLRQVPKAVANKPNPTPIEPQMQMDSAQISLNSTAPPAPAPQSVATTVEVSSAELLQQDMPAVTATLPEQNKVTLKSLPAQPVNQLSGQLSLRSSSPRSRTFIDASDGANSSPKAKQASNRNVTAAAAHTSTTSGMHNASGAAVMAPRGTTATTAAGMVTEWHVITDPEVLAARNAMLVKLPNGQLPVSTVMAAQRMLAVDPQGSVFLSDTEGKSWEPVAAQWKGRAVEVRTPPLKNFKIGMLAFAHPAAKPSAGASVSGSAPAPSAAVTPIAVFELVTDDSAIWTSVDGKIWTKK